MPDLSQRLLKDEILDDLQLKGSDLNRTLEELTKINRLLLNTQTITKEVLNVISSLEASEEEMTIIDLGCGAGDILIHLAAELQKRQIRAKLIGIDGNPHSISFCREAGKNYSNLRFISEDIQDPGFALPPCDIMISSHFMYHLTESEIIHFLANQHAKIKHTIIISELVRHPIAYYLFRLISPVWGVGDITYRDGLTAIRRAYTFEELKRIIDKVNFLQKRHYRFLLFRQILVINLDS